MSKYLLWVLPVGVAAGLSIPLAVPYRKAPPAPIVPPAIPRVSVESFELRSPRRALTQPTEGLVAGRTDSMATFASQDIYSPSPLVPRRSRGDAKRRSIRRLDSRSLRKMQVEDSRAWQAANRMLMYERRSRA